MLLCRRRCRKKSVFQQECKQNRDCLFLLKWMEVEVWKSYTEKRKKKKSLRKENRLFT